MQASETWSLLAREFNIWGFEQIRYLVEAGAASKSFNLKICIGKMVKLCGFSMKSYMCEVPIAERGTWL